MRQKICIAYKYTGPQLSGSQLLHMRYFFMKLTVNYTIVLIPNIGWTNEKTQD